jgi:hypothetical protein
MMIGIEMRSARGGGCIYRRGGGGFEFFWGSVLLFEPLGSDSACLRAWCGGGRHASLPGGGTRALWESVRNG